MPLMIQSNLGGSSPKEMTMYIGGGILGTILVVALIVFLVRRI